MSTLTTIVKGLFFAVLLPGAVAAAGGFDGGRRGTDGAHLAHQRMLAERDEDVIPRETFILDPIIMKVMHDDGSHRRVKVQVAVELASGTSLEAFQPFVPRVRHAILTTLSRLDAGTLSRIAGREKIRKELKEQIHALGVTLVVKVLFTEFWVM
jgi:flagellar basal body-associated protein FliL